MSAETQAPAFGGHYLGIGHASRVHRGSIPYWERAQQMGLGSPENLRTLERGTRPMTELARKVIRKLAKQGSLDLNKLDRDLAAAESNELAELSLEARVLLRDMFLTSVRRYKGSGEFARLRAEQSPVSKARARQTKASHSVADSTTEEPSQRRSVNRALAIPTRSLSALDPRLSAAA